MSGGLCISDVRLDFQREPLASPFGFKGGALRELWQVLCAIRLEDGTEGLGVGVQSVLWSDARVYERHTPAGANALMFAVTEYAAGCLAGQTFQDPPALMRALLPRAARYAQAVTAMPNLSPTFALNALVAVDFALWQLYAATRRCRGFDEMTAPFTTKLTARQPMLGNIPLISYDKSPQAIHALAREGAFLLKIKIGANPGGRNDPQEMLRWDCERLSQIHEIVKDIRTPYTECGHPAYYLDANGRYDSRARLEALLTHAEAIGALERIVLLEEPFAQDNPLTVTDLPVRVAADESAHSAEDIPSLLARGYRAIALKPIAKTLSGTLEILEAAGSTPCFCADLTVPPIMLEWNENVAARLPILPGLKCGVIESNGAQNYIRWESLRSLAPQPDAPWLTPRRGSYRLDEAFFRSDALLKPAKGYLRTLSVDA